MSRAADVYSFGILSKPQQPSSMQILEKVNIVAALLFVRQVQLGFLSLMCRVFEVYQ